MKLGPYELDQIYTGDARELAKAIPDESVDLIFTDPVYWQIDDYQWLAKTAERILKRGGDLLVYYGQYYFSQTVAALSSQLDVRWPLVEKKLNGNARMWVYGLSCNYKPLIWCTKGHPRKLDTTRVDYIIKLPEGCTVNHDWAKGTQAPLKWLARYSQVSDLILDPFCGGGSTMSACKILNRHYLAFEIDPDTAERARQRVQNTQPPLFVPQPEQAEMFVE